LAPLTGLSELTKLEFRPLCEPDGVEVVCQLTGKVGLAGRCFVSQLSTLTKLHLGRYLRPLGKPDGVEGACRRLPGEVCLSRLGGAV
jgi:hypothetical protein